MREKGRAVVKPSQAAAISRLRALILAASVANPKMVQRHRKEWPLLWESIDQLVGDEPLTGHSSS